MALNDFLFGTGEGGKQTSTTTPFQGDYLQDLFGRAQGATAEAPESGGFGAGQLAAADAFRQGSETAGGFLGNAQGAQDFLLNNALNPGANPALQEYLKQANDALALQYQQQILPSITSGNVAAGNVGSSRAGVAEGIASQGLSTAQGRTTADILQGAYGQGLNALTQGLSLTPGLVDASFAGAEGLSRAAGLQGSGEQAGYNAELQNLQNYLSLIGGNYGGTTETQLPGTDVGGLPGILGLLSSGASIYSATQTPAAAGAK